MSEELKPLFFCEDYLLEDHRNSAPTCPYCRGMELEEETNRLRAELSRRPVPEAAPGGVIECRDCVGPGVVVCAVCHKCPEHCGHDLERGCGCENDPVEAAGDPGYREPFTCYLHDRIAALESDLDFHRAEEERWRERERAWLSRPTPAPNREAELKVIEAAKHRPDEGENENDWPTARMNRVEDALASLAQAEMKGGRDV